MIGAIVVEERSLGGARAGLLLERILITPGPTRRNWTRYTSGNVDRVSFAAVAQVIATYLWDTGEVSDDIQDLPRRLRDRVRRALTGLGMSRETLRWFVAAFELDEQVRRRLEHAMDEPDDSSLLGGSSGGHALPVERRYRTVSIAEHHWVGSDRCPTRHVTRQVIEGIGEPLDSYLYMFDTNTIEVQAVQGARSVGPITELRPGVYGVEIVLFRPLTEYQTATLMYESTFAYPTPPEPEFRRAAFPGLRSLDLRVQFDATALPKRVEFAEWNDLDNHEPSRSERAPLESDLSVHRFLGAVDHSIVGFRWTWD